MFGVGYTELVVLGIVAVILFGKRLPEVARSVGGSYAQFRQGLSELQSSMSDVKDELSVENLEFDSEDNEHKYEPGPKFEPPAEEDNDGSDL